MKGEFPDPKEYELIILSGGENVLSGEKWIENVIEFIKITRADASKTKVGYSVVHSFLCNFLESERGSNTKTGQA